MSTPYNREQRLLKLAQRYIWLLGELHGGNAFSKEQLWLWLAEANASVAKDDEGAS